MQKAAGKRERGGYHGGGGGTLRVKVLIFSL